jgi:hypothetical protein
MALLLLVLGLIASNEQIHARLHADSPVPHSSCSVCALAKGQLDAPVIAETFGVALQSLSWIIPSLESVTPSAPDFSVATSRGPPAHASSL